MRVGCPHLLPQILGTGVCCGHLRYLEKILLLHLAASRLSTAQEVLAEVVRRVEIKLVFHLPSYSPRGIVHPGERRLFFFFNLAQMHQ